MSNKTKTRLFNDNCLEILPNLINEGVKVDLILTDPPYGTIYRTGSSQFSLCTEQTYDELINVYHIDELDCFKPYDELKRVNGAYESKFHLGNAKFKPNVLEYRKSYNRYHPTEKPVDLLKDLILTYTDEEDTVLDFTMGSGSTGVACLNTSRDFIGIELDENYFNIAKDRINEAKVQRKLSV